MTDWVVIMAGLTLVVGVLAVWLFLKGADDFPDGPDAWGV